MKASATNTRIFNIFLIYPAAAIYLIALVLGGVISPLLPEEWTSLVPGIARFSRITEYPQEAISAWSFFWVSMPFFILSTIYISFRAKAERKAGVVVNLALSIFMWAAFLGFACWFFVGPAEDSDPGKIMRLYQHTLIGFVVVGFSAWIGFYGVLYGAIKGILINFERH
jgi:hypothetical protein